MKRRNEVIDTVVCHRDGALWGEYVTAGQTYRVVYPRSRRTDRTSRGRGVNEVHFERVVGHSATFMRFYSFLAAIERGDLEIITPTDATTEQTCEVCRGHNVVTDRCIDCGGDPV